MKNFVKALSLAILAAAPATLLADEIPARSGFNVWLGLDLGSAQSIAKDRTVESSKVGAAGGGKLIFSLFSPSLLLEGGVGWQMSRLRNEEPKPAASEEARQSGLVDREIVETRSGVGELAARYRIGAFEIGPAAQALFGADTTYSPYLGKDEKANGLAGLGVYYGWYGSAVNQRLGLQIMTDVTIDDRQVSSSLLQYYVSIPVTKPRPKEKVVIKYREKVKEKVIEKRRYIVDAGFINFETKKFEVDATDQAFLAELGAFLADRRDKWAVVFITSHTDHRGGDRVNVDLSKSRANAVAGHLSLPAELAERVQIKSRASAEPVEPGDAQIAMARNRRVEIEVVGAIDVVSLKRAIAIMRQKFRGPGTCSGDSCL
jgi:outer membrane protein OmpA-like peptidoglycan-associated protein